MRAADNQERDYPKTGLEQAEETLWRFAEFPLLRFATNYSNSYLPSA